MNVWFYYKVASFTTREPCNKIYVHIDVISVLVDYTFIVKSFERVGSNICL